MKSLREIRSAIARSFDRLLTKVAESRGYALCDLVLLERGVDNLVSASVVLRWNRLKTLGYPDQERVYLLGAIRDIRDSLGPRS